MKTILSTFALLFIFYGVYGQKQSEFYQLKQYLFKTERQEKVLDAYLETAFLPALHRLRISDVGVFKSIDNVTDTLKSIYILIPYSSLDQFIALDAKLVEDKKYQKAGSAYINAKNDDPPYSRIKSTLMKAFKGMPKHRIPVFQNKKSERVYELRSYESPTEKFYTNKVHMFNVGSEIVLFDQLEFNAVFYAEVISGSNMPNLMYMTSFSDRKSRDSHWKAFFKSPGWETIKSKPEYKIDNMSRAEKHLLYPTNYSDY
ncbi:MAG: NIPSNAP family protein [Candidatus Scalindua sp.]